MEFRKIYIKRLLPVLLVMLVLILMLVGHSALKAEARAKDTEEQLKQMSFLNEKEDGEKLDTEYLKTDLQKEVYEAVLSAFMDEIQNINLSEYFTEEDYESIYSKIESSLLEQNFLEDNAKGLSEEQKAVVNSLIGDALSLYSENYIATRLSDDVKEDIKGLIEKEIKDRLDSIKSDLTMSDSEKSALAGEISQTVQHSILEYITEHIQIIYGEGSTPEGGNSGTKKELDCDEKEHVHEGDCYSRTLICDKEEDDEHTHTDECYEYDLVCDEKEHIHSEECYKIIEGESQPSSGAPGCVHVHVDYLLTDEDRANIVSDILAGTDLGNVLSNVFYDEIQKDLTEIVKEKMFEAVLEELTKNLEEKMNELSAEIVQTVNKLSETVDKLSGDVDEIYSQLAMIENSAQTIRYNEITGRIECLDHGEWKDFMSASSIWASNGILYSAGKKSDEFTGFSGFITPASNVSLTESANSITLSSTSAYSNGYSVYNTYTTDPNAPFEYSAQYNTLQISYGIRGTTGRYEDSDHNGSHTCYLYHTASMTVQIIDYTTNEVVSQQTASSSGTFSQGTMELKLPDGNPYVVRIVYGYRNHSSEYHSHMAGTSQSGNGYIYSMQCVKR